MSNDNLRVLRQLGTVADVASFCNLANSKACTALIFNRPDSDDFRRLQRQGYSALVLAALTQGLRLYNACATAAAQPGSAAVLKTQLQLLVGWLDCFAAVVNHNKADCLMYWGEGSRQVKDMEQELLSSGVLPIMQHSWRQLAADMQQQQRVLQQQHPDSTAEQPAAQAGLRLTSSASLTGELLQLWAQCASANAYKQTHLSQLNAAVSSVDFLADVATGVAAIWRSEGFLQQLRMADDAADSIPAAAVRSSVVAAKMLVLQLFLIMNRKEAQHLPGSGAAHDLQWVSLVYTALLVGKLHQQQQGVSPVQLHTQPAPSTGSSSAGSSKKGSSKKASRAQQASSSSAAASSQQGSIVPPHHLQVLQAAGVPPDRLMDCADLRGLVCGGALPTAATTVSVLLQELHTHLKLTSSSMSGRSSSARPPTSTGRGSSPVLALLAPCSQMWGEFLALHVSTGSDAASPVSSLAALVTSLWYSSLMVWNDTAAQPAMEPAGTQKQQQQRQQQQARMQDGWYRSCVELIMPSLLHMRAAGVISAAGYSVAAGHCLVRLELLLATRLSLALQGNLPGAPRPSTLPEGCPASLPIFSNPSASIMSLEAAVRHDWDAPTASGDVSTGRVGPSLACEVITALAQSFKLLDQQSDGESNSLPPTAECSSILQHGTDSSKSPALLSLLLSCLKQLQRSCQGNAQGALMAAGIAGMVSDFAVELFNLCVTFSTTIAGPAGDSSSVEVSAASSSSSALGTAKNCILSSTAGPRVLEFSISRTALEAFGDSAPLQQSAAEAAPSTGPDPRSEAAASDTPAGGEEAGPRLTAQGTSRVASTWLVLLSRVLYTAGAALQALAAGAATTSVPVIDILYAPTSAAASLAGLCRGLQAYASIAGMFLESDAAASAVARRRKAGTVQVLLPGTGDTNPAMQAYLTLATLLGAATQRAQQLEAAAAGSAAGSVGGLQFHAASNMRIWRQVLGSEQGRQLPQALMDVGSMLCAALPDRSCCNEPSCCCLDKPSELQLAMGKGTKCSGCGVARYCSPAHQKLHWKQHKPACRAFAAPAAGEASK